MSQTAEQAGNFYTVQSVKNTLGMIGGHLTDVGPVLKANEEYSYIPAISGWKSGGIAMKHHVIDEASVNKYFNLNSVVGDFLNSRIPLGVFGIPKKAPLMLRQYRNVFFMTNGSRITIYKDGVVDNWSSAILSVRGAHDHSRAEPVEVMGLCDDQFLPENPCHFLADRLTRVKFFKDKVGLLESQCYLTRPDASLATYFQRALAPSIKYLEKYKLYFVKHLLILSSTLNLGGHPFWFLNADAFAHAEACVIGSVQPSERAGRKVYFSRFDAARRKLINETEVAETLKSKGFEIYSMSKYDPADQLSIANSAEIVVAPHGAAITNIIACRRNTKLIELFHPARGTTAYAGIALLKDIDYLPLFGKETDKEPKFYDGWKINLRDLFGVL